MSNDNDELETYRFCPGCGTQATDKAKFCGECGQSLRHESVSATSQPPHTQPPTTTEAATTQDYSRQCPVQRREPEQPSAHRRAVRTSKGETTSSTGIRRKVREKAFGAIIVSIFVLLISGTTSTSAVASSHASAQHKIISDRY